MAKKTAKQEFLDKENKTQEEKLAENILVNFTKTKIATIGRALREINKVAYTSTQKAIPFEKIIEIVEKTYKMSMTETENADI